MRREITRLLISGQEQHIYGSVLARIALGVDELDLFYHTSVREKQIIPESAAISDTDSAPLMSRLTVYQS